jgi:hypothetical protein
VQKVLRSFRRATKGLWGRVLREGKRGKRREASGKEGEWRGAVAVI